MVSLGVESLITNVPTYEIIDIIITDLFSENKLKTVMKVTQSSRQKLLNLGTQAAHFMNNSEFYTNK